MGAYDSEIRWWKARAASFDAKRAALRPLSFDYLSGAYRYSGNQNGAWTFDSSSTSYEKERNRLMAELKKQGEQSDAMFDVFARAKFNLKSKAGAAAKTPTHASILAPSQDILSLEKQNETLGNKIKDVGGTFFKNAFSGLGRVADVLSRFGYAIRTSAKGYADAYTSPDSAGGTKTTGWEAIRTFVNPVLDLTPTGIISHAAQGNIKTYQNMWAGLSGKEKTSGSDVIKELYPEWTSNHKKWTSAVGFATDVIYDPLTFLTVGQGSVVTTGAKVVGAAGAKVTGRAALSETLMKSTVFSKTGRASGRESLEDYLKLKTVKPEAKAASKAERTFQSMQKKYDKAAPAKQAAMQPALTRSQAAMTLAKQHLDDAIDKTATDSFKGIQLARKAIFNKTLGTGSWDAYTKGVRQGGLKTETALKYERTAKALKDKVKDDWRTGTGSVAMRRYHAAMAGEVIKYGGKSKTKNFAVPEDYDEFLDQVAEIIMPHVPIRELTRNQLKRRSSIVNAKEAEAKQFFTELKFAARSKYKDGEPPLPDLPEPGPSTGGASASPSGPGAPPSGPGGGRGPSGGPTNAPPGAPPVMRVTHSTTADEDVANIVSNTARQAETNQAAFDKMSDAEKAYATRFGYEPSVMSYRLFAQHLMDSGDAGGSQILDAFKSDLESGLRQAKGEGKFKQGSSDVGFQVDREGLTEVKPWREEGASGANSARYDRTRNQEIAKVISEAWGEAQGKLANDMLANDPVAVVNAMQGVVAHLLNQVTADTHLQVSQFLSSKYGLSFLPMAPNRAVVHPGGLRGAVQRVSDLRGFIQRGVKSKPSLSEPNVKGFDLYRDLNQKLEIDLGDAIGKLEHVADDDFNIKELADVWNGRDIGLGFADTSFGRDVVTIYQNSPHLQSNAPAVGGSLHMATMSDAVATILQKGEELIDALHFTHDESISKYSVLDHWMYGDNAAKEMKIGEHGIGRMAHIEKIETADQDILANLKETLPTMDEDLLAAMRVVKANLANHGGEVPIELQRDLKELMQHILAPDYARLHTRFDGTPSAVPVAERAMETLGWHLDTLVSTTVRRGPTVGVRAALAREIWSTPILFKELNQSIMLGTLHQVFVKKHSMEQAADELAAVLAKYPLVQDLMKASHEQGVANGTNGMRTTISTVDPTPTNVPAPATVAATPDASTVHTPVDETSATDPNPAAESSKPSPQTQAEGEQAAATGSNPPGGFTTPDIDPEASAQAAKFLDDIQKNVDVAGIQKVMDDAESSFTSAMAEYSAKMENDFKDFQIRTGNVVRFAGIPIMPLPTLMNPMHSYAGVVGLKEHQSRVGNWLDKAWPKEAESRLYAQMNLRRPSKGLDPVINDIRRSVSNNAQERLTATHKVIRESYMRFKNRADRQSDTQLYFTAGKSIPSKFTEIQERLDMIGRSITHDPDGKVRSERVQRLYGQMFNRALPSKYRLPEEVFDVSKFQSDQTPFSREWLIAVSEFLDTQAKWSQHTLTATNLKSRLHMGNYEFALQHALSKLELSKDMHTSMFDNFSFHMPESRVKELNKTLAHEDQFVRLDDYYSADLGKYVNKEFKGRWVRRGIADEMGKVTRFVEMQNQFRKGDFNFGVMTKINNYWKSVVTNWNIPKYHIGNIMADGFLNAMDGVRPEAYRKAATVMTHSHPLSGRISKDPEGYQRLMRPDMTMDPGNIDREMKEIGDPKRAANVSTIMVNGKPTRLDSEMIIKLYHDYGLGQTQVNGNLLRSSAMGSSKANEFYTKTTDYVLDLSNGREDYFRLAHFIHAMESEAKIGRRSLDEISIAARDRVIKYHFDYGDVTEFERLAVARYLPFYKWQRNILPLALGQMFVNPRMYTIGNSANQAMGEMMFPTQEDANGNEIPISYITPDFVGDSNMVPIGKYTDVNGNEQARYAVLNLPLEQALVTWLMPFVSPFMDQNMSGVDQASEGTRSVASTLMSKANPFIVAMQQAGLGKTAVTGDSFDAGPFDWLRTLGNVAFPNSGMALEYLENKNSGKVEKTVGDKLGFIRERDSTESIQRGTLHQQNDKMTAVYAKAAAKWMKANHPGVDPKSEEGKKLLHDYFVSTGTLTR